MHVAKIMTLTYASSLNRIRDCSLYPLLNNLEKEELETINNDYIRFTLEKAKLSLD
jgi:hypothetical protein